MAAKPKRRVRKSPVKRKATTQPKTQRKATTQPKAKRQPKARTSAKTIDEYLAGMSGETRTALENLRKIIRATAPQAVECISYQIAAYKQNGMLVGFGATPNHCSFYLMSPATLEAHKHELASYDTSKGTIHFRPDAPLPVSLVRKLVKTRIAENGG